MPLTRLSRVIIRFSPWDPRTVSARDLLNRLSNARARKSNPDCKVDAKIRVSVEPSVTLHYTDGFVDTLSTVGLTSEDILRKIKTRSDEQETTEVLHKVGMSENRIDSGWGGASSNEAGVARKVPPV